MNVKMKICYFSNRKIFLMNGSVVDAAVATLICNGMVNSQSMGLGGGFLMTLYLRESQTAVTLNARESAPLHSNADMFNEDSKKSTYGKYLQTKYVQE
jgi:gamma-glutamyltranspeptidase/glutathione hydrolase/leukotriene-C4 hydrolase